MLRRHHLDPGPGGRRAGISRGIRMGVRAARRRGTWVVGRRAVSNLGMRVVSNLRMRVGGHQVVNILEMREVGRRAVSNLGMQADVHRAADSQAARAGISGAAIHTVAVVIDPKVGRHTVEAAVEVEAEVATTRPQAATAEEAEAPKPAEAPTRQRGPGGFRPDAARIDCGYPGGQLANAAAYPNAPRLPRHKHNRCDELVRTCLPVIRAPRTSRPLSTHHASRIFCTGSA
jgi:hypothetical protein